ncbi:hypothetical protein ACROYT_G019153 [Oculina patagonica]
MNLEFARKREEKMKGREERVGSDRDKEWPKGSGRRTPGERRLSQRRRRPHEEGTARGPPGDGGPEARARGRGRKKMLIGRAKRKKEKRVKDVDERKKKKKEIVENSPKQRGRQEDDEGSTFFRSALPGKKFVR